MKKSVQKRFVSEIFRDKKFQNLVFKIGRTYEKEEPEPMAKARSITESNIKNKTFLQTFEKCLRAGVSEPEIDGTQKDYRPYFLATPSSTVIATSESEAYIQEKGVAHKIYGKIEVKNRPEDVSFYDITTLNPALLDSIPSTMVTPIPTLLFSYPKKSPTSSPKVKMEAATIMEQFNG